MPREVGWTLAARRDLLAAVRHLVEEDARDAASRLLDEVEAHRLGYLEQHLARHLGIHQCPDRMTLLGWQTLEQPGNVGRMEQPENIAHPLGVAIFESGQNDLGVVWLDFFLAYPGRHGTDPGWPRPAGCAAERAQCRG